MEAKTRRSGIDRRKKPVKVAVEKRKITERRTIPSDNMRHIDFMRKIPVFNGLTNDQYIRILNICYQKTLPEKFFIYEQGDESNEMFILIKGKLSLVRGETELSTISPYELIGELGVFSGKPRLTSLISSSESTIMKINNDELFRLFRKDPALSNRIMRNVIIEIAQKFQEYIEIIEELQTVSRHIIV